MWKKGAALAVAKSSITDAPGLPTSKMVVSYSNPKKPHLVTYFKNGKLTCDCLNNTTRNLCAHVLAVAETQGLFKKITGVVT